MAMQNSAHGLVEVYFLLNFGHLGSILKVSLYSKRNMKNSTGI